ncbi:phosphoribosylglycinamide formyltransferase [Pseudovibrio exalbescens]|uniref:Phosphoribosylglycinamide formyltransferase n=1 Tax=Pseudovibrio exalbescens TaxID=197461 RepID=A0A1U7JDZ2_9HYPH|nr:phosphoribosylglycinamide formyltransferase [Pseudovibrio exalbescens]OKL42976.1 phosphoribosylglycinamide formyltransferase [Pseudovibrio exalbescens]
MTEQTKKRVAILISGRGSNMVSLIEAATQDGYPAEVVVVGSNRPDAPGLEKASQAGLETFTLDHKTFGKDREAFDTALSTKLKQHKVDLVVLAGFMRLLTRGFTEEWAGRMINIHPALLPSFPGLNTHERALEAGVKLHGATVHFVTSDMDAGPIIMQGAVPVLDEDTPETLGARVLDVEHQIYPEALALVAADRTRIEGQRVTIIGSDDLDDDLIAPTV